MILSPALWGVEFQSCRESCERAGMTPGQKTSAFWEYQAGLPDAGAAHPGDGFSGFCNTGHEQLEQVFQHHVNAVFVANVCTRKTGR